MENQDMKKRKLRTMSRRETSYFKGTDYLLDVDTDSWRKERCRGGIWNRAEFGCADTRPDETYMILLDRLLGSSDLKMEQDYNDPTYMMFLENLKEHGNSYVLGVSLENGLPFPVKYEATGHPSGSGKEDIQMCSPSTVKNLVNSQKKNPVSKPSGEVGYSSGQNPMSNLRANTMEESCRVFTYGLKANRGSVFYEYGDHKRVYYKESDQHKLTDAKNGPSKTGSSTQVPPSRPPVPRLKSTYVQNEQSKTASATQFPSSRPFVSARTPKLRASAPTHAHTPRSLTAKDRHKVSNKPSETASKTEIPTEPLTPALTQRVLRSASISAPRASIGCPSGLDHRYCSRANTINKPCMVVVFGLEANRESDFYEKGDGKQVCYKDGNQQKLIDVQKQPLGAAPTMQIPNLRPSTPRPTLSQLTPTPRAPAPTSAPIPKSLIAKGHCDVQNKPSQTTCRAQIPISRPPTPTPSKPYVASTHIPRAPTSSPTPITLKKDHHNILATFSKTIENKGHASRRSFRFLKELESICREPHEQKEYENLLEEVSVRKPIIIHKETRGGEYTKTGALGKSYLDKFPDLDNEIKKVKSDPKKVLNLLRGFFLYLVHVPHGVPRPWRDDSCMAIMLGST